MTSVTLAFQSPDHLDIQGDGIASITGFSGTPGVWSLTDTSTTPGQVVFNFSARDGAPGSGAWSYDASRGVPPFRAVLYPPQAVILRLSLLL